MLRKSYDASAAHVVLDVKPDGGVEFMIRAQDGGTTQFVAGATMDDAHQLANRKEAIILQADSDDR